MYDVPSKLDKRGTSLGYGNKYDFTKYLRNSAPFYNIKSDFDTKQPYAPSFTFGISREYYEKVSSRVLTKVYIEGKNNSDKSFPGPGAYSWAKPLGSNASKYSMSFRTDKNPHPDRVPGPGAYNSIQMNVDGKYPNSTFKNATSIVFGVSKEPRFKYPSKSFLITKIRRLKSWAN